MKLSGIGAALCCAIVPFMCCEAADMHGLTKGDPQIQVIGPMAFGPEGLLFVGDPKSAVVFALQTGDKPEGARAKQHEAADLLARCAELLSVNAGDVTVQDIVVNPATGNLFLGLAVKDQGSVIARLDGSGKLSRLDLKGIPFSEAKLPNPAEDKVGPRGRNPRDSAITDLAFLEGQVLVSGLSSDEAASNVWSLLFPFNKIDTGTNLEIYHGAHGRSEDNTPIRTFVPFIADGEPSLLAGFICTPLVKFPIAELKSTGADKVRGTTVAELGNRNQPLDMIAYKKGGKDYLLLANSARGVMKVNTDNIAGNPGITEPVKGGGIAGQPFEKIDALEGTVQLDLLDDQHAVVVIKSGDTLVLKTVPLP